MFISIRFGLNRRNKISSHFPSRQTSSYFFVHKTMIFILKNTSEYMPIEQEGDGNLPEQTKS